MSHPKSKHLPAEAIGTELRTTLLAQGYTMAELQALAQALLDPSYQDAQAGEVVVTIRRAAVALAPHLAVKPQAQVDFDAALRVTKVAMGVSGLPEPEPKVKAPRQAKAQAPAGLSLADLGL